MTERILPILRIYPFVIPLVFFSTLSIMGALSHPLWSDEAETAFFAGTILQSGLPKGFDGVNITGIENAIVLDENLVNHRSPWAQYYLTAASFAVFGKSSFTARLPFIILSGLSLVLIYHLTLRISRDKTAATISTIMASLSVTFILYSFQDRYYSLIVFCGLIQIITSFSLTEPFKDQESMRQKVFFVLSGILFAYSNYVIFLIFLAALFLVHLLIIMIYKKSRSLWFRFTWQYLLFGGVSLLFILPWLWVLRPWDSGVPESRELHIEGLIETVLFWFQLVLGYFNTSIFPNALWLVLFFLIGIKLYKKEDVKPLLFLSGAFFLYFLVFALFDSTTATVRTLHLSPTQRAVVLGTRFADERYHVTAIPILIILVSLMLIELRKLHIFLFYTALGFYILTNGIVYPQFRSLIAEYIGEITNPYPVSDQVVADFLKVNARDGDTAFINSDRAHEPVMFLLGEKKIKFVNRISPTNERVFPKNYHVLPKYIYNFRQDPDWVIKYSSHRQNLSYYDFDIREFNPVGKVEPLNLERDYDLTVLPVFYGSDVARPEIEWHKFKKIEPKEDEKVFMYHKKK